MWILLCIRNKIKDFVFKQTKYYHDFRGLQKVSNCSVNPVIVV